MGMLDPGEGMTWNHPGTIDPWMGSQDESDTMALFGFLPLRIGLDWIPSIHGHPFMAYKWGVIS